MSDLMRVALTPMDWASSRNHGVIDYTELPYRHVCIEGCATHLARAFVRDCA